MSKFYVTFGMDHNVNANNFSWNKHVLCEIDAENFEDAENQANEAFGDQYYAIYTDIPDTVEYKRGVIHIESDKRWRI